MGGGLAAAYRRLLRSIDIICSCVVRRGIWRREEQLLWDWRNRRNSTASFVFQSGRLGPKFNPVNKSMEKTQTMMPFYKRTRCVSTLRCHSKEDDDSSTSSTSSSCSSSQCHPLKMPPVCSLELSTVEIVVLLYALPVRQK